MNFELVHLVCLNYFLKFTELSSKTVQIDLLILDNWIHFEWMTLKTHRFFDIYLKLILRLSMALYFFIDKIKIVKFQPFHSFIQLNHSACKVA